MLWPYQNSTKPAQALWMQSAVCKNQTFITATLNKTCVVDSIFMLIIRNQIIRQFRLGPCDQNLWV